MNTPETNKLLEDLWASIGALGHEFADGLILDPVTTSVLRHTFAKNSTSSRRARNKSTAINSQQIVNEILNMINSYEETKRQLDEARHKLELCMAANSDVARIAKKRDEALQALMKIEDLFIDGTDIYADRENMGIIARNALEGAK